MATVTIRPARMGEEGAILSLLHGLADYEKLLGVFHITEEDIRREMLGPAPLLRVDLAFDGGTPVGIATWYWKFGSFAARRILYLEDLFVLPSARGTGSGKALLAHLAKIAVDEGGGVVDWQVLDWNKPSIAFYESIGAKHSGSEWLSYRLDGDAAKTLAGGA